MTGAKSMHFLWRSLLLGAATLFANASPPFVGTADCAQCHAKQAAAWKGSHHDLAMQKPDAATVLGNFAGATFAKAGLTTTFARRGDREKSRVWRRRLQQNG